MILQTSQHIPKHNYRTYKLNLDQEIKDNYIGMKTIKLSLFAGDISVYIENPKEFLLIPRICGISKVADYKENTQKSTAFLCIHNKHVKTKIKNTIPFLILPKKMEYFSINPTRKGSVC